MCPSSQVIFPPMYGSRKCVLIFSARPHLSLSIRKTRPVTGPYHYIEDFRIPHIRAGHESTGKRAIADCVQH